MIRAELVFDGVNNVIIPTTMGTPCDNQLYGTEFEKLGELSSRICYDSLGVDKNGKPRGRSSEKLHQHILEVKNHSVYEHINLTIAIYEKLSAWCIYRSLLNRKGVHVELPDDGSVEITLNPRVLLEWQRHSSPTNTTKYSEDVYNTLYSHASALMPQILRNNINNSPMNAVVLPYDQLNEHQIHISLFLANSRSWSHEQVRHRFAMSQRSTRYVDESESEYVPNYLIEQYIQYEDSINTHSTLRYVLKEAEHHDKRAYRVCANHLEKFLTNRGVDKTNARKQAFGAARDYLANALYTEMIYTTNLSGWAWIIENRLNKAADNRMRFVYADVLDILKGTIHAKFFDKYSTVDSPDGLGKVLSINHNQL